MIISQSKLLTIFHLVNLQSCVMMYKVFSNKLPHQIQSAFLEMNIEPDKQIISSKYILKQLKDRIASLIFFAIDFCKCFFSCFVFVY